VAQLSALEAAATRGAQPEDRLVTDRTDGQDTADAAWFRNVFDVAYTPLTAYARRRTVDASEADDVVAEVFTVAWRRRAERSHRGGDPESELPWLYGIASNTIRNHRRSLGRRLRLVERIGSQPRAPEPDPADRAATALRAALERLPFDDRELLRLIAWEGLSHAEVGTVLGVSANAVAIRAHRARKRLEVALTEDNSSSSEEGTT
jgi:RNA polymerase sigma-70 factor (ECF subfamily)